MFGYLAYALLLQIWSSHAVEAELTSETGTEALNIRSDPSVIIMSQTAQYPVGDFVTVVDLVRGDWKTAYGGDQYLACGFFMYVESAYYNTNDIVGVEGLSILFCNVKNWYDQKYEIIFGAINGSGWPEVKCTAGEYINSFQAKYYDDRGSADDIAVSGLKVKCSPPTFTKPSQALEAYPQYPFSDEKLSNEVIDYTHYICDVQAKRDTMAKHPTVDTLGITGLKVRFCNYKGELNIYRGSDGLTLAPVNAPKDYYACGIDVKTRGTNSGTSILSVRFVYCSAYDWSQKVYSELNYSGYSESWQSTICSKDTFIVNVRVIEIGFINRIECMCRSPKPEGQKVSVYTPSSGSGTLRSWQTADKFICGAAVSHVMSMGYYDKQGVTGLGITTCDYKGPIYTIINLGFKGDWLASYKGPANTFACGASVRMHSNQSGGDDTAVNALKLIFCNMDGVAQQPDIKLNEGLYGDWENAVMCPKRHFINGASVRYLPDQGNGDDSGITGLKITCTHIFDSSSSYELLVKEGWEGDWTTPVISNKGFVCAGQVRFDSTTISNGKDATGLQGLTLDFCSTGFDVSNYKHITKDFKGDWQTPVEGPSGYYACGLALKTSGDEAAVNAFKLIYCKYGSWEMQETATLNNGTSGEWKEPVMCPMFTYIHGASVKLQVKDSSEKKNSTIFGIRIKCKSPKPGSKATEVVVEYGQTGSWADYVEFNQFFCGGQVGFDYDYDSRSASSKGLKLKVCDYTFSGPYYEVIADSNFGSWSSKFDAPADHLACGFASRVHPSQGVNDDAAVTGLKIVFCNMKDWNVQKTTELNTQPNIGSWKNPIMCPKDTFIHAVQARVEPFQKDKDDSALNSLNFKCENPKIYDSSVTKEMSDMTLGIWGPWVSFDRKYACGAELRVDPSTISTGQDATGVNGLALKFCEFKFDTSSYEPIGKNVVGNWLAAVEAPEGFYACGMSAKKHQTQTDTAVNALKLIYCSIDNWLTQVSYSFNEGQQGDWIQPVMCPKNRFISAVRTKSHTSNSSYEDGTLNDIELKCISLSKIRSSTVISYSFSSIGTWSDWVEQPKLLCGGQVRVSSTTTNDGDNTVLNGLKVKYCDYSANKLIPEVLELEVGQGGDWFDPVETPELVCGLALKYSDDKNSKGKYAIVEVKLIYCGSNWKDQGEVSLNNGLKGTWKKSVMCPEGLFMNKARAKVEPVSGPFSADYVLSGVEFKCKDSKTGEESKSLIVDNGGWAIWRDWIETQNGFVCGGATRFESDTSKEYGAGVFGLAFRFC